MTFRRVAALVAIPVVAWTAPQAQAPVSGTASGGNQIFVCGDDARIPAPIPLTWQAVVLAGDARLYVPCPYGSGTATTPYQHTAEHREAREAVLLDTAFAFRDADLHWRAAQAYARLPGGLGALVTTPAIAPACNAGAQVFDSFSSPRRWQPGRMFSMLRDSNPAVQQEGAFGIGVALSRTDLEPSLITAATKELQACFKLARSLNLATAGLILEDLGIARYTQTSDVSEAEQFIVQESQGPDLKVLGAVKGLEVLLRQHPQHQISNMTRARLRELVMFGGRAQSTMQDTAARIRRLAVMALQAVHDDDSSTLSRAAEDGDWQVRRLVAGSLNLSDAAQAPIGARLADDSAFQVRYELMSPLSRLVARTHECAPLAARFKDPSPAVAMRAMDLLSSSCTDLDDAVSRLAEFADQLRIEPGADWHVPARALSALARIKPAAASVRIDAAVAHPAWQVRATAATISGILGLSERARTLATDTAPNVRTAALEALYRMKSGFVVEEATKALDAADFQLLRMAAQVLKGLPDDQKEGASSALLASLRRLTDKGQDPSRDPRVAILERLAEALPPTRSGELLPYVEDYDDAVSAAASKAFQTLVGSPPAPRPLRRRYPSQPPQAALDGPPTQATIFLERGIVTLELRSDVAPVTVARFTSLASVGYYNGLTFHRVVPNFVVQGGSPGANEYMGTARYMRDEVGPQGVHVRGAVGISTRGGDTGDGQIFIDLVDLPRLDRDYTVFAYVTSGMELVDNLLEGARIVRISVR